MRGFRGPLTRHHLASAPFCCQAGRTRPWPVGALRSKPVLCVAIVRLTLSPR
jgi:hypothetical protein